MTTDWWRVALLASATGALIAAGWCLSTFAVSEPFLPLWPAFALLAGMAPIHIRTVVLANRARNRAGAVRPPGAKSIWRSRRETHDPFRWRQLPSSRRVGFSGLFFALWAMVMTALWSLRNGGPEIVNGDYFANSHGSLTPISLATFHHLQLAEQRALSGVAGMFYLLGVLFNIARTRPGPEGRSEGGSQAALTAEL
jgi:hypothetical protein